MGQDELVLKIPSVDSQPGNESPERNSSPSSSSIDNGGGGVVVTPNKRPALFAAKSPAADNHRTGNGVQKPAAHEKRTHSRESSGASVKFVNGNGCETTPCRSCCHRRTASGASSGSVNGGHCSSLSGRSSCATAESHVVILSPSEDVTLSDRLDDDEDDDDLCDEDLEEADLLLKGERRGLSGSVGRGIDEDDRLQPR